MFADSFERRHKIVGLNPVGSQILRLMKDQSCQQLARPRTLLFHHRKEKITSLSSLRKKRLIILQAILFKKAKQSRSWRQPCFGRFPLHHCRGICIKKRLDFLFSGEITHNSENSLKIVILWSQSGKLGTVLGRMGKQSGLVDVSS